MKFFLDFIRSRIITLVCIIIAAVIFAVVLSLYNLSSEPVLYALLLSLAAGTSDKNAYLRNAAYPPVRRQRK